MVEKISRLSIKTTLLLAFLCLIAVPTFAEENNKKNDSKNLTSKEIPFFKGISVGYDLMGPIYKGYSDDYISHEFFIDFNFKNRFLPVVEVGYGKADKWGDKGINYKTKAPYIRFGMDYNFLYKKEHGSILSLGLRYAFTSFDYEIEALPLKDGVWGDEVTNPNIWDDIWKESVTIPYSKQAGNMHWLEFVASVRTKIISNLHMSLSLRMRRKINAKTADLANPWYIPGYGIYKTSRFGMSYSIIYTIPFGKKK